MNIEINVIHQIVSILQDKSIGEIKIPYGHNLLSLECLPYVRKALSGKSIILYFLVADKAIGEIK